MDFEFETKLARTIEGTLRSVLWFWKYCVFNVFLCGSHAHFIVGIILAAAHTRDLQVCLHYK